MSDVHAQLMAMFAPGECFELRALKVPGSGNWSGVFRMGELEPFDAAMQFLSSRNCPAHYITCNPVKPELYTGALRQGSAVGNGDIAARHWFYVDCDPIRPADCAATDEEMKRALERRDQIRRFLDAEGWPEPLVMDSGNGGYLVYRVDLPQEDGGVVERVLDGLSMRFTDEHVKVDTSVHNAGRVMRLAGTLNCKGANTPERPWRMASLVSVPQVFAVVPQERLNAVAAPAGPLHEAESVRAPDGFDLEALIAQHLPDAQKHVDAARTTWKSKHCPWNANRPDKHEADLGFWVVRHADGGLGAGCHHDRCSGKSLKDVRWIMDALRQGERDAAHATIQAVKSADLASLLQDPVQAEALARATVEAPAMWDGVLLELEKTWPKKTVKHLDAAIRKEAKRLEKQDERRTEADDEARVELLVDALNLEFAAAVVGGRDRILRFQGEAFEILTQGATELILANRRVRIEGREVPVYSVWRQHSRRRQYPKGPVFEPGPRGEVIDVPGAWNTWRGFAVTPEKRSCIRFLRHLRHNICGGDRKLYKWLLAWMAHAAQYPGERSHTAVVLRGGQGTGKGTFAELFGSLFGPHYHQITTSDGLVGKFNVQLMGKCVVFADEAHYAGNRQAG